MPKLANKKECCGCASCFNVCPKKAISMVPNEGGFLYPFIDTKSCIKCNKCEFSCPVINPLVSDKVIKPRAFIGQHNSVKVRKESTSGGIFSSISEIIIGNNGVVFGASMSKDFVVKHMFVENIDGLSLFRNSKYVQSEIGETYCRCKEFLEQGKMVCFSGTPCQIHGVLKFLGKKYDNLITVDIVCHSVPSPLIFSKYIELQNKKFHSISKIVFRDKAWGYSYSTMAIYDMNKCVYRKGSETDLWFRSFLPGLCDRENCYDCKYQQWPRLSDITIWDCFNVGKIDKSFDDDKGTTSVIAWTVRGQEIFEQIVKKGIGKIKEVEPNIFTSKIEREKDEKVCVDHHQLYLDANQLDAETFFQKYRPYTFKVRCKSFIKTVLRKLKLIRIVKKITD